MKKIICIVGPTGSGKTGLSLEIAEYLKSQNRKSCIINADSRQVYKDFPIITAQPLDEEKSQVSHKLYGFMNCEDQCNAGIWLDLVHKEIDTAYENNVVPILVGGTGMYIKALTEGIAQIPKIPEEISSFLVDKLNKFGVEKLYSELENVDQEYSKKIHKNDRQRICRALEVYKFTNKTLTEWHQSAHSQSRYDSYKIGVGMPLDELTPYLYKRIELMLEQGALEEAKKAYENYKSLSLPGWSGIGCQELGMYIKGIYDFDEAKELWEKNTRAYAKRQWTWFRADKKIDWCHPFDKEKREKIKKDIDKLIN